MKVLGIVAEYNPFHNGHIYHIEKSRELTGCDAVVCVMSGNFIQRGEPALVNKFSRAEMALNSGADLVIELPHPYAMASAEAFAYGAVKILDGIGIVDCISFGSEHGNTDVLDFIAGILASEPQEYRLELKNQLEQGQSFAVSRQKALQKYLQTNSNLVSTNSSLVSSSIQNSRSYEASEQPTCNITKDIAQLLETSNNILGIEYLKALRRLNSSIRPFTITRVSNSYNSSELTGSISSATAIRNSIFNNKDNLCGIDNSSGGIETATLCQSTSAALPLPSQKMLNREFSIGRGPVSLKSYEQIILGLVRRIKPDQLRDLPDVSEGLEYRIKTAGENSGTIEDLIDNICTKRYAQTRIQRILSSLLTGLSKTENEMFMDYGGPQYARILGFNNTGRQLLSGMKKSSELPVIMKAADFKSSCNKLLARMLEIEAFSTDMYVLGYQNSLWRKSGQEYTQNVIIKK